MKSNQSLEPTAGRCEVHVDFMKQFSMFAALARVYPLWRASGS